MPAETNPTFHWKARIQAVDDSLMIRNFLKRTLEAQGYECEIFSDGATAVQAAVARPPDLFLTDLNMPGMDGFQVLSELKRQVPNVPVIMLTASAELDDALKSIRSGAVDYVTKPIDVAQMFEVIGRILRIAALEVENRRYVAELARRDEELRKELQMAKSIHQTLLPSCMPSVTGYEFGLALIPSREIGGDIVGIYDRGAGRIGVVFADLTGHGVPAALLFVLFKAFADDVFRTTLTPAECFQTLNSRLAKDFPSGHFASTSYIEIDPACEYINLVKASQEPVLILRADGSIETIEEGGPLLGAFDPEIFGKVDFIEKHVTLAEGDSLFLYTDGLVEVTNAADVMLELNGLLPMLREEMQRTPQDLVMEIHRRIVAYAGQEELDDDFTALSIRRKAQGE